MDPQQQPQSRRSRKVEEEQKQPECPLPSPKGEDSDLPPGTRRKALPDGGFMIVKDNFIR